MRDHEKRDDLQPPEDPQQRFIETLLEATYKETERRVECDQHIAEALARLDIAPPVAVRPSRSRIGFSLAASFLLVVCAMWFVNRPSEATAERLYRLALTASQSSADREYLVVTQPSSREPGVSFKLHLRGASQFAVDFSDSFKSNERMAGMLQMFGLDPTQDVELWAGSDGTELWFVPPVDPMPVYVSHDMDALNSMLEKMNIGSTPWLTIESVLQTLGDDYRLTLVPPATEFASRMTLRGGKVSAGQDESVSPLHQLPEQIDLQVDPDTGTVHIVDLHWNPTTASHPHAPRRVTFRLINERAKPDDWYRHEAHHAPDRAVMPFPTWMQRNKTSR